MVSKKNTALRPKASRSPKTPVLRFAHPYFAAVPPDQMAQAPAHQPDMLAHIQGTLHPIPFVKRGGRMTLADVIGQDAAERIANAHQITFHVAGDTGVPELDRETEQVFVADAMAKEYDLAHPELCPAFFFHLGDVIYGPNPNSYLDQFYRPYMHYPGKIIAIPGNHDGESPEKIKAFQKYFCAPSQKVPPIAGSIFRQTMNQPGVYWFLDAPFVQIIGLYSNSAENPGFISSSAIGQKQKQWLVKTLTTIKASRDQGTRKALIFASHHPPYSTGGHSGSTQMLQDIDDACTKAGILPDAFFSGHAHSIQRYTRSVSLGGKTLEIPYVVSGCGGHGGQLVDPASNTPGSNPTYDFAYEGWGFTTVKVTATTLTITSCGVDKEVTKQVDTTTVTLS